MIFFISPIEQNTGHANSELHARKGDDMVSAARTFLWKCIVFPDASQISVNIPVSPVKQISERITRRQAMSSIARANLSRKKSENDLV